jgi:hypothetical protein
MAAKDHFDNQTSDITLNGCFYLDSHAIEHGVSFKKFYQKHYKVSAVAKSKNMQ